LKGYIIFTFPNITAVYISDPDTRESITGLEAINTTSNTVPVMLILPGLILLEYKFNNNINDDILFVINTETGTGFINNQLAIN
jgi:hypothetical protein